MIRYGAALLVRLFFIAELCINGGLPLLIVLPWASADDTIRSRGLYRKIAHQVITTRFASSEYLRYEVITNYREISDSLEIETGLATFIDETLSSSRAPCDVDDRELDDSEPHTHDDDGEHTSNADDDLIKQQARRPYRLANDREHTGRHCEHLSALSGMRSPKISLQRVPDHYLIGGRRQERNRRCIT